MSKLKMKKTMQSIVKPKSQSKLDDKKADQLLSWYSTEKSSKFAFNRIKGHMKKKYKVDASEQAKTMPPRFGYICCMLEDKKELPDSWQKYYDSNVNELLQKIKDNPILEPEKPKITIQDRLRMKADDCIGELEGQVDDIMNSDFKVKPSALEVFKKFGMKFMHIRFIKKWAENEKEEWEEALSGEDVILTEAYGLPKSKLKKMVDYYNSVIEDCSKIKSLTIKKTNVKV